MKNSKLDRIIKESVDSVIAEMGLTSTENEDPRLVKNEYSNAWKMIHGLMGKIKDMMVINYKNKKGRMTQSDIDELLEHINLSIDNILGITIKR